MKESYIIARRWQLNYYKDESIHQGNMKFPQSDAFKEILCFSIINNDKREKYKTKKRNKLTNLHLFTFTFVLYNSLFNTLNAAHFDEHSLSKYILNSAIVHIRFAKFSCSFSFCKKKLQIKICSFHFILKTNWCF